MDPINDNQQITNQQAQQQAPTTPPTSISTAPAVETQNAGGKKTIILLIILIILAIGILIYVLFVKNQLTSQGKTSVDNATITAPAIPTITPKPTPATIDDVQVESPEANLNEIEKLIQGL